MRGMERTREQQGEERRGKLKLHDECVGAQGPRPGATAPSTGTPRPSRRRGTEDRFPHGEGRLNTHRYTLTVSTKTVGDGGGSFASSFLLRLEMLKKVDLQS